MLRIPFKNPYTGDLVEVLLPHKHDVRQLSTCLNPDLIDYFSLTERTIKTLMSKQGLIDMPDPDDLKHMASYKEVKKAIMHWIMLYNKGLGGEWCLVVI